MKYKTEANKQVTENKSIDDKKSLTRKETNNYLSLIKELNDGNIKNSGSIRKIIYELKLLDGYKCCGFKTWSEFCGNRLNDIGTVRHIDRIYRSAEVEAALPNVPIGTLPESATRELHKFVGSGDLVNIWEIAKTISGKNKYPTAEQIKDAISTCQQYDQVIDYIRGNRSKGKRINIMKVLLATLSEEGLKKARKLTNNRIKQKEEGKSTKSRANKDTYSTNSDIEVDV